MVEEIKKLRIEIDGLAQLVKSERKPYGLAININHIPKGWEPEKWVKYFRESNNAFVDSEDLSKSITTFDSKPTEMDKCYDSLILAKAWLGKVLGELGTESPYPKDGTRKTVEDIEPTADTKELDDLLIVGEKEQVDIWYQKSYIEKVDWLRQEIEKILEKLIILQIPSKAFHNTIYQHLSEARFWLGFELQRIKEEEDNGNK